MEVLSKKGLTIKEDALIRSLFANCVRVSHQNEISELTIKLRRKYTIKLPDAIIAATAQFCQLPLLTGDKAFSSVDEIDCCILSF